MTTSEADKWLLLEIFTCFIKCIWLKFHIYIRLTHLYLIAWYNNGFFPPTFPVEACKGQWLQKQKLSMIWASDVFFMTDSVSTKIPPACFAVLIWMNLSPVCCTPLTCALCTKLPHSRFQSLGKLLLVCDSCTDTNMGSSVHKPINGPQPSFIWHSLVWHVQERNWTLQAVELLYNHLLIFYVWLIDFSDDYVASSPPPHPPTGHSSSICCQWGPRPPKGGRAAQDRRGSGL